MAKIEKGEIEMNIVTWPYILRSGHSDDPATGACAMDAVNWLVHGRHGDEPECVCPVIAAFVVRGNDSMPDDVRQRLLPYLHRIAGSRSKSHEADRSRILWLAAVRIFAPRALDAAGLCGRATILRDLPDDVTPTGAAAAARAASASAWASAAAAAGASANAAASAAGDWATSATSATTAWAAVRAVAAWDDYFAVLDSVLNAGPQGEAWSADVLTAGTALFVATGGVAETVDG